MGPYLLVSNHKANILAVAEVLNYVGKQVVVISNALQALKRCESGEFDIVIADQSMEELDGWTFIKEFKTSETIPNKPVILLGAKSPEESNDLLNSYGVLEFIIMPSGLKYLPSIIDSTIRFTNTSGTIEHKYSQAKTAQIAKQNDKAIDIYSDLRVTANNNRTSIGMAQTYVQMKEFEKAQELFAEVVVSGDQSPTTLLHSLKFNLSKREIKNAVAIATEIRELMPNNSFFAFRIAQAYLEFRFFEEAKSEINQAHKNGLDSQELRTVLAKALFFKDHVVEAINVAVETTETYGKSHDLQNLLGVCYRKIGQYDDALECFEDALCLTPMDYRLMFNIGLVLLMKGKPEDAENTFESCLKIKPDFTKAQQKLDEIRGKKAG